MVMNDAYRDDVISMVIKLSEFLNKEMLEIGSGEKQAIILK
jgi:hypothetical protein